MGEDLAFWLFAVPWWLIGAPALAILIAWASSKLGKRLSGRKEGRKKDDGRR